MEIVFLIVGMVFGFVLALIFVGSNVIWLTKEMYW